MAQYRDTLPSQQGQGWIHELARGEINPDAERILNLGKSFDPQQLIEESTVDFLMELRECFTEYARVLNSYSESSAKFQEIKIYSSAGSPADFMMFRNQIKLVVANTAHGAIQFSFAQHYRGGVAVDGQQIQTGTPGAPGLAPTQELIAQVGPFRDIRWMFQGEKVTPEQVARFYFAEFVRMTRDVSKSRMSNQLLLEQVKALLQDKGIQL